MGLSVSIFSTYAGQEHTIMIAMNAAVLRVVDIVVVIGSWVWHDGICCAYVEDKLLRWMERRAAPVEHVLSIS